MHLTPLRASPFKLLRYDLSCRTFQLEIKNFIISKICWRHINPRRQGQAILRQFDLHPAELCIFIVRKIASQNLRYLARMTFISIEIKHSHQPSTPQGLHSDACCNSVSAVQPLTGFMLREGNPFSIDMYALRQFDSVKIVMRK